MYGHTRTQRLSIGGGALIVCGVVALGTVPGSHEPARAPQRVTNAAWSAGSLSTAAETTKQSIDLALARRATAPYRHVRVAQRAGYALPPTGPLHQCITDYQNTGAMGFHYLNGDNAGDTVLDPAKPEALVYHRSTAGRFTLGALEYVVFAEAWDAEHTRPPRMFGREMMLVKSPNRYELPAFYMQHVWLWRTNPLGRFVPFNPAVSCHGDAPAPEPTPPAAPTAPHGPAV